MCGIIGIVSEEAVTDRLVDGLRRMEYRGYDSSGVCVIRDGQLIRRRAEGKLANLVETLRADPADGVIGIAHTRWATHGAPTASNAHPHATDEVAIVHNGIIENFKELRRELAQQGRVFESETDSEVVAHLISSRIEAGDTPEEAVRTILPRLRGAFALAITFRSDPDMLIGARLGSPLVVGHGDGEMFLGSDALALAPMTDALSYLEEGDMAVLSRAGAMFYDAQGVPVERPRRKIELNLAAADKGSYKHFMMKEIAEQPRVLGDAVAHYTTPGGDAVLLPETVDFADVDRVVMVACGTAFYACLVAKYWFEQIAQVPVEVDVASEYRYRTPPVPDRTMARFVSQSGETADPLAALRYTAGRAASVVAVVNQAQSSIARESDVALPILAGPEIA
ncbi:MAG: glutamine--fructose-6-phosphate transaminase (isomerizing), partial [Pseudomonadota bacterium]